MIKFYKELAESDDMRLLQLLTAQEVIRKEIIRQAEETVTPMIKGLTIDSLKSLLDNVNRDVASLADAMSQTHKADTVNVNDGTPQPTPRKVKGSAPRKTQSKVKVTKRNGRKAKDKKNV